MDLCVGLEAFVGSRRPLGGPGDLWVVQETFVPVQETFVWVEEAFVPHRGGLCASLRSLCAASGRPLCQPGKPLCRCGTPLCGSRRPLCRSRRPLCGSRRPLSRPGRPLCRSARALHRSRRSVCASSGRAGSWRPLASNGTPFGGWRRNALSGGTKVSENPCRARTPLSKKRKRCASAKNGASRSGPRAPPPPLPGPSCARTFPTSRNATSADDGSIPADLDALLMTMARTAPSRPRGPTSLMRLRRASSDRHVPRRPPFWPSACGCRLRVVVAPREPCGGREGPRRRPTAIEYVLRRVPAP